MTTTNYSTIVIDLGSGIIKTGFSGEDGPRNIFNSIVGVPKMMGLKVGMEQKERYVGDEAIALLETMDYVAPIQRGEICDWEKFETLMQYLFYDQMKIVPEEISVLVTECPLSPKLKRAKLAETLFETFNVQKIHIANSSMLGLFSYGKTSGLIIDSGFNVTSSVPVYQGYPLQHASVKLNIGGEDLSKELLNLIQKDIDVSYKFLKGRLLADDIKEKLSYITLTKENNNIEETTYTMPDGKEIKLTTQLIEPNSILFYPSEKNKNMMTIPQMVIESINKCDSDIKDDIKESICLAGGNSLLKYFPDKLRTDLSNSTECNNFNISFSPERQFSSWVGGSIMSSLDNFQYLWVSKEEFDENGTLYSVDSKCF